MSQWVVRRGEQKYPVTGGTPALVQWAKSGRILPNDYVLNPTLNQWQIAKDVPELHGSFRAPSNPVGTPAQLGCLGAVLLVAGPVIGWMLLGSNAVALIGIALGILFIFGAIRHRCRSQMTFPSALRPMLTWRNGASLSIREKKWRVGTGRVMLTVDYRDVVW